MKTIHIFYFVILVAFSSCKKEVPHPAQKSNRLVVFSYISPNNDKNMEDPITVSVSLSRPAFGSNIGLFQEIKDEADINISDGKGKSGKISWSVKNQQYELSRHEFTISAGETYTLKVTANGQSVSAQTSIPEAVKSPKFSFLAKQYGIQGDPDQYRYKFCVQNSGLTNGGYYQFYPMVSSVSASGTDGSGLPYYGKDFLLVNDHTNHGAGFDKVLTLESHNNRGNNRKINIETEAVGVFVSCSKEFYLFQTSAPVNVLTANDPDIIRPQVGNIYSNMKSESVGGSDAYGVFAGYNEVIVQINQ